MAQSDPKPDLISASMIRWITPDAVVVADLSNARGGVYLNLHVPGRAHLDDPAALIAALTAAEQVVAEHLAPRPLSKDEEIAFRKDWDARVTLSSGTGGIRHPSSAPTIIGSRPRTTR